MIKQLNVWISPMFPSFLGSVTLIMSHQLSTYLQLPLPHPITLMKYHSAINSKCLTSCEWLPQTQKASKALQCVSRWFIWSKALGKHIFLFWWRKSVWCVFSVCVAAAPSQVTDVSLPTATPSTSLMGDAFVLFSFFSRQVTRDWVS